MEHWIIHKTIVQRDHIHASNGVCLMKTNKAVKVALFKAYVCWEFLNVNVWCQKIKLRNGMRNKLYKITNLPDCRIYTSLNYISFVSGIGLSPLRRRANPWTNADLLWIGPFGTNFCEIQNSLFVKMHLRKSSSAKWKPLRPTRERLFKI